MNTSKRDTTRDHWRSEMVNHVARELGYNTDQLQTVLIQHPRLAESMRVLLDELTDQEYRGGRTHGMAVGCRRRCIEIANAFRSLASANAPAWLGQAQPQQDLVNDF